jgi:hypothetical protein
MQSDKAHTRRKRNLNRPVCIEELKSIFNNLPKEKVPSLDRLISKFYQIFKEEITPNLYTLSIR